MSENPLGKQTQYPQQYDAALLYPVSRLLNRKQLGLDADDLPFSGFDHWRAYELSWLLKGGKPVVAMADIIVPCDSPFLIESKSMKLYFNSLNQHEFVDYESVQNCIVDDLSRAAGKSVQVRLHELSAGLPGTLHTAEPSHTVISLDNLQLEVSAYQPDASLLTLAAAGADAQCNISETLVSDLFRSNCPITAQPDWGTISVSYSGAAISHASLLSYIISFRQHEGFHEHCVEKIYCDIQRVCAPTSLTVSINFLRRGGLEINPIRSSDADTQVKALARLLRQ